MNLFGEPDGDAERERQLAELVAAVRQAQQAVRKLRRCRPNDDELKLLFGRLEVVRLEVEQMRRRQRAVPFEDIDPKWTALLPWRMIPEC